MTMTPALLRDLRMMSGRCMSCGWHIEAQGHAPYCGDALKDEAFKNLDGATDADVENAWLRREILALGARKLEFTADDLPADVRESTNPNRRGRVFAALVNEERLLEVGRVKSRNPKAHGKTVGVYRLRT